MRFEDLDLSPKLLANITRKGYATATPIQAGAIPHVLAGRDVLGSAQTGTGKTAAFALPIIHRLTNGQGSNTGPKPGKGKSNGGSKRPRCLVLCPTRELATQIAEAFQGYAEGIPLDGVVIYGGASYRPQVRKLQQGVDVIVATPGRLMDLMEQGYVDLSEIETLVLDEADRMLDMGFMPDIKRITKALPAKKQTLLFSATLPGPIVEFARTLLHEPETVSIKAEAPTADRVEQFVHFVDKAAKADLLAELIESQGMFRTIVFSRTKHGADKLVKQLKSREIRSEAIHGNKSQNARQRTLDNFRRDKVAVLVATDVAARGIDVSNVSHVVNYDLTHEPETYVHRIGRTARAGAEGVAISLCDPEQVGWLRDIERLLGQKVKVVGETPSWAERSSGGGKKSGGRPNRRGGGGGRGGYGGKPRRQGARAASSGGQASGGGQGGGEGHVKTARQRRRLRRAEQN